MGKNNESWLLPTKTRKAELILSNRKDVLDRFTRLNCWLKNTLPLEEKSGVMCYQVSLYYEKTGEPELVIRLISMWPDIQINVNIRRCITVSDAADSTAIPAHVEAITVSGHTARKEANVHPVGIVPAARRRISPDSL